jgi:hypothetical protein
MDAPLGIREMADEEMMAGTVQDPMNPGRTQRTTKDDTVLSWAAWRTMEVEVEVGMAEGRPRWTGNGKVNYIQHVSNFA